MKIEHRIENNITIVSLNGALSLDDVEIFKTYMKPLIENDTIKGIALNFDKINFMDSSGVGVIMSTFQSLRERGKKLAMYNIGQENNEKFKITQFDQILNFQKTEEDAISTLKGSSEIEHYVKGRLCIVKINGNLTSDSPKQFSTYAKPLIENEAIKGIVINLVNTYFIDSSGVGQIMSVFKSLQQRGNKMAVYNINQKNLELFSILGLDKILLFQKTEEEALSRLESEINYEEKKEKYIQGCRLMRSKLYKDALELMKVFADICEMSELPGVSRNLGWCYLNLSDYEQAEQYYSAAEEGYSCLTEEHELLSLRIQDCHRQLLKISKLYRQQ